MSKLRQAAEQEPVECMCGICKLGKREWVGLTDAEKRQILIEDPIDWINAIEAKLKEKNT